MSSWNNKCERSSTLLFCTLSLSLLMLALFCMFADFMCVDFRCIDFLTLSDIIPWSTAENLILYSHLYNIYEHVYYTLCSVRECTKPNVCFMGAFCTKLSCCRVRFGWSFFTRFPSPRVSLPLCVCVNFFDCFLFASFRVPLSEELNAKNERTREKKYWFVSSCAAAAAALVRMITPCFFIVRIIKCLLNGISVTHKYCFYHHIYLWVIPMLLLLLLFLFAQLLRTFFRFAPLQPLFRLSNVLVLVYCFSFFVSAHLYSDANAE